MNVWMASDVVTFTANAADANKRKISYSIVNGPSGATYSADGVFTWPTTSGLHSTSPHSVTLRAGNPYPDYHVDKTISITLYDPSGMDITGTCSGVVRSGLFAKINTDGRFAVQNNTGYECAGVFTTTSTGSDQPCTVRYIGIANALASGGINPGAEISSKNDGFARASTAGHYTVGIALTAAVSSGDVFSILLVHQQKNA